MKRIKITGIRPLSPVGVVIAAGTVAFIWALLWGVMI